MKIFPPKNYKIYIFKNKTFPIFGPKGEKNNLITAAKVLEGRGCRAVSRTSKLG